VKNIRRFDLHRSIRAVHRGEAVIAPSVTSGLPDTMRKDRENAGPEPNPALSETQLQILRLVSEGLSNRQIAAVVHLSENTIKSHLQEAFRKLKFHSRVEAALVATRDGWI
jgi:DNA-binding NarL/FixJ family response regulator